MRFRGRALDQEFAIESDVEGVVGFVARALSHLAVPEDGAAVWTLTLRRVGEGEMELLVGERPLKKGAPSSVLAWMMSRVNVEGIRAAGHDPVIHCGVVARNGSAMLLPGSPGAGKSTTVTALSLRGMGYSSDEAGPIQADGTVRPYPKPIVVGRRSWQAVHDAEVGRITVDGEPADAWWLDPTSWGCQIVSEPLRVGAVVTPEYRPETALHLARLSRAEATALMASNAFNLEHHGAAGLERLAEVARGVVAIRATFGDVDELCVALGEMEW